MAVDDHGLEVLKKAGEQVTPGDKSDLYIKTSHVPKDFEPPLNSGLIGFEDSISSPYFLTVIRYYDGGTPSSPGNLLASRTFYYEDPARCDLLWMKIGEP